MDLGEPHEGQSFQGIADRRDSEPESSSGVPVPPLWREHSISSSTFYKRRTKYGGKDATMFRRMKEQEGEGSLLKRMYADIGHQNELLKEALGKKF